MGISKVLWFLPLKLYYGKPKGNGIDWVELPEDKQDFSNQNIEIPIVASYTIRVRRRFFIKSDRKDDSGWKVRRYLKWKKI